VTGLQCPALFLGWLAVSRDCKQLKDKGIIYTGLFAFMFYLDTQEDFRIYG
jgi:hypothetical protein